MMPRYGLLLTDLYQLTMMQAYHQQNMDDCAVFEFFVRKLPDKRNFLIAAGLEQVVDFIENAKFEQSELQWLSESGRFQQSFIQYLQDFRFTGDVYAMPEGTVFFANEPVLRVVANITQAQLLESRIINLLHFQILVASKAARCVLAAPQKLLVDFGMRRAHGGEAGLFAARASYIAGFSGTSTVMAGQHFKVPIYGTMAHSFVQAHNTELSAFENFAYAQTDNVVLLIDTYDTETGAEKTVEAAKILAEKNIHVQAVRLDSGDLAQHAFRVRKILDDAGLKNVKIFASGNLDEYRLQTIVQANAPIDGFGVGTALVTSADCAYLDCAYKLQEYAGVAKRKRSEGKATWPGRKQVYRKFKDNIFAADQVTLEDELVEAVPLIKLVMKNGKRCIDALSIQEIRDETKRQLNQLPESLKQLSKAESYPVEISSRLQNLAKQVDSQRH